MLNIHSLHVLAIQLRVCKLYRTRYLIREGGDIASDESETGREEKRRGVPGDDQGALNPYMKVFAMLRET